MCSMSLAKLSIIQVPPKMKMEATQKYKYVTSKKRVPNLRELAFFAINACETLLHACLEVLFSRRRHGESSSWCKEHRSN